MPKSKPAQRQLAIDLILHGMHEVEGISFNSDGTIMPADRTKETLGYVLGFFDAGLKSAGLGTTKDREVVTHAAFEYFFADDHAAYFVTAGELERSQYTVFLQGHARGRADYERLEAADPGVDLAQAIRRERYELATSELRARLKEFALRPAKYGHRQFQRFHEVCLDVVKFENGAMHLRELRPRFPGVDEGKRLGGQGDYNAYTKLETLIRTGRVNREEARNFLADMFGEKHRKHMDYLFDAIRIVVGEDAAA
jgi:hypothetical protein